MGDGHAEVALEEADIVRVRDDHLFALNHFGGLSIVELRGRDQLELVARIEAAAKPLEMYLRDDLVVGVFSRYFPSENTSVGDWAEHSRLLVVNVSEPRDAHVVGELSIRGGVLDSRLAGDVLYLVMRDEAEFRTLIVSVDVSDPGNLREVDRLQIDDVGSASKKTRHTVTIAAERMYLGVDNELTVVDTSDAGGELKLGTTLVVDGVVQHPWQVHEHDDVLRVVASSTTLQTFSVISAEQVTPLGRLELSVRDGGQVTSSAFEGGRGFLGWESGEIVVVNLDDPMNPQQLGQLDVDGSPMYIVARGSQAVGFGNSLGPDAPLSVWLVDASDPTAPTLSSTLELPGFAGSFNAEWERLGHAIEVVDDRGLILVPFKAVNARGETDPLLGCADWTSEVAVISWSEETLSLRGTAGGFGRQRRGLVVEERLLTVADERIQSFDLTAPNEPERTADVPTARQFSQSLVVGGHLARLSQIHPTDQAELSMARLSEPGDPRGLGSLELGSDGVGASCKADVNFAEMYGSDGRVYAVYKDVSHDGELSVQTSVLVVDVEDAAAPVASAYHKLGFEHFATGRVGSDAVAQSGRGVLSVGQKLAFLRRQKSGAEAKTILDLVDLSRAESPGRSSVEVSAWTGQTGLFAANGMLYTSHFEPIVGTSQVRFYLDEIDISEPGEVRVSTANIPGSLLSIDPLTSKLITVEYRHVEAQLDDEQACFELAPKGTYEESSGLCRFVARSLQLVRLEGGVAVVESTVELEPKQLPWRAEQGTGVLFLDLDGETPSAGSRRVAVLKGFAAGKLELSEVVLPETAPGRIIEHLAADGEQAIFGLERSTHVVDASGVTPVVTSKSTPGYVGGVSAFQGVAYVSLGYDGIDAVPLR